MVDEQEIANWEVAESRGVYSSCWGGHCDTENALEGVLEDAAITCKDYTIDVVVVFRCESIADNGAVTMSDIDARTNELVCMLVMLRGARPKFR